MPLTLAIVGFGRLAQNYYAPALKRLEPDARYVIVDPSQQSRDRAQAILPVSECYWSLDDLVDLLKSPIDAALISSPPTAHFRAWRILAEQNIPLFMEKPFPLPQDLPLICAQQETSDRLFINFNRRFWPPYQHLLSLVKAGAIGTPRTASLQLIADLCRWNPVTDHRALEVEGGVLHDLGGHVIDLAIRLFGAPSEISSSRDPRANGDRVFLTLHWSDGRSASCVVGYGKGARETIAVVGSKGRLRMNNPHGRLWKEPTKRDLHWGTHIIDLMSMLTYAVNPADSFMRFSTLASLQAFLHGVRTGESHRSSLDEAIHVAWLLAAAEESLLQGRTIDLSNFKRTCASKERCNVGAGTQD